MARKRKSEQTRRARSTLRQERALLGTIRFSQDWECPFCSRWFARRRNGPRNHLRFCKQQPKPLSPALTTSDHQFSPRSDSQAETGSSTESESFSSGTLTENDDLGITSTKDSNNYKESSLASTPKQKRRAQTTSRRQADIIKGKFSFNFQIINIVLIN